MTEHQSNQIKAAFIGLPCSENKASRALTIDLFYEMPDPLQWCLFMSLKGDWRQRCLCLDADWVCMEPLNRKVVVLSCVTYLLFQIILYLPFILFHSETSTKTMDQHLSFHQSLGGRSDEQLTALSGFPCTMPASDCRTRTVVSEGFFFATVVST
jgi:hypothetical protein